MNAHRLLLNAAIPLFMSLASLSAYAQQTHIRGEVTSIDATQIIVKGADGASTTMALPAEAKVLDVSQTSLDAIADKSYIGVAGVANTDGKVHALGVMVFPEGARGQNEGSFPWDLRKKSSMTNATVSRLVKSHGGAEVEVRYGGSTQTIAIDKATVFGTFVPGDRALIVKGAKVLVFAETSESAKLMGGLVMVGRNGFLPPI